MAPSPTTTTSSSSGGSGRRLWFLQPYYLVNLLACTVFFLMRLPLRQWCFPEAKMALDSEEVQVVIFLGCVIVIKSRRPSTRDAFMSSAMSFFKVANLVLFFWRNETYFVCYLLFCAFLFVFVPQVHYIGDHEVMYLTPMRLQNLLERDRGTGSKSDRYLFLEFYATWSPECQFLTPTFCALSNKYTRDNFVFAKLDVGKHINLPAALRITAQRSQLPTIVLFKNGEEVTRIPGVDDNGKAIAVRFSEELILQHFELDKICSGKPTTGGATEETPAEEKKDQ